MNKQPNIWGGKQMVTIKLKSARICQHGLTSS